MTIWEILKLEPTNDTRAIKKAYAARTRDCHPEEAPEAFQELYEAYRAALKRAERARVPDGYDRAANKDRTKRKFYFDEQDQPPVFPLAPLPSVEWEEPLVFPPDPTPPPFSAPDEALDFSSAAPPKPPREGETPPRAETPLRFDVVERAAQAIEAPPDFDRLIEKGLEQKQQEKRERLSEALRGLHRLRADPHTKGDTVAWRNFLLSPLFFDLRADPSFLPMLIDFLTNHGDFPNAVWLEFYKIYDFSETAHWSRDYMELYSLLQPRYQRVEYERREEEKQKKRRKGAVVLAAVLAPVIIWAFAVGDMLSFLPPLVYLFALIVGAGHFQAYTRLRRLSPLHRAFVSIGSIVSLFLLFSGVGLLEATAPLSEWAVVLELMAIFTIIALFVTLLATFASTFRRER